MRVAALDLGSNTFLCLIAEFSSKGELSVLHDEAEVVRLGQDVDKSGEFHPDALARAEACLKRFKTIIEQHQVDHILAAATSAARDASNGDILFAIGEKLGIPIEIIQGEEEARISFQGATLGLDSKCRRLVVDIGGGSTELIVGKDHLIEQKVSFDIGGVRLTEKFITEQPISQNEQKDVNAYISDSINAYIESLKKSEIEEVIAVAGTPTAIAAIELGGFDPMRINNYRFPISRLEYWKTVFAETSVDEKKKRYNLGGRADIIYAGSSILLSILQKLEKDSFKVSVKGVRYGIAMEIFKRHRV